MPKMKSNRGAKKRFRTTATGKLKFRSAYRNHILTKKTTQRKRHLRSPSHVAAVDSKAIKRMIER